MADGDGPVLATVVPVYNEAAHVEACLLSLLNQTLNPSGTWSWYWTVVQRTARGPWFHPSSRPTAVKVGLRMELLQNPKRTVAHARNLASRRFQGPRGVPR
ncbi:MAG: hypothetical protein CM15mP78_15870 [Candidatus Poseidoniales archaeon]|nr:MAG: hypothetical protein CM15mP78_15870 [Candidatus Poseidoniales archaeon]